MAVWREVPDTQAGPTAIGLLLPPGERTFLIVRPRALSWDLLLLKGVAEIHFWELGRAEGMTIARQFAAALRQWSAGGAGQIGAVPCAKDKGYLVWVDIEDFALIACAREPGRAYQPFVFAQQERAQAAVEHLRHALGPNSDAVRELYFNTRNYAR